MGWPRKDEGVRLYSDNGYRFVFPNAEGKFQGLCLSPISTEGSLWSVERDEKSTVIFYGGIPQVRIAHQIVQCGNVALDLSVAVSAQVIYWFRYMISVEDRRKMGDVGRMVGVAGDGSELRLIRCPLPKTYGGSAKRLAWDDIKNEHFKREAVRVLGSLGLTTGARGLHRIEH